MKITTFSVQNYKCFRDSETFHLSDGFNVVVGPNNVGKSALLEALGLQFPHRPHLSPQRAPFQAPEDYSSVTIGLSVTGKEIEHAILKGAVRHLPLPQNAQTVADAQALFAQLRGGPENTLHLRRTIRSTNPEYSCPDVSGVPALNGIAPDHSFGSIIQLLPDGRSVRLSEPSNIGESTRSFCHKLAIHFASSIYRFDAERLRLHQCQIGKNYNLRSDASNLAEVLHFLDSENPKRFERLNKAIQEIFPNIHQTKVRFASGSYPPQTLEVMIWPVDPTTERSDLQIPLLDCGTGLGQVLAMLYVAMNSEEPRCIVIDEPNSFLHPGAAKKLIQLLRSHHQHQYIVTTHSPEMIRAADPDAIIRLDWDAEKAETTVRTISTTNLTELSDTLAQLGVSLSDVFGADNVVWVEGPTERECFPRILSGLSGRPPLGVSIVPIHATGDFQSKRVPASTVLNVYRNLSTGNALVPPTIGFVFDRERKSDRDLADLKRASEGRVHILSRRMYESYLLHPGAIAAVLNGIGTADALGLTDEDVTQWIARKHGERRYGARPSEGDPLANVEWLKTVDAARLLGDLFQDLGRTEYRKVSHGLQLTNWLIEHAPQELQELCDVITRATEGQQQVD